MSKKLILFLMVLLFGSTSFLRADEVTIGSLEGATANSYLPMNSLYNYSYTQQIYTAEEIGTSGTINAITMWLYGNANLYEMPFNIYMKEVDKDAFESTTDWVVVAETDMVYTGTVTVHNTEAEAYTFTLDTPFAYSGTGNLLIAFNNTTGQWKSGLNGMAFGATGDAIRAIYARQDSGAYNPYEPTFTATSTTYQRDVVTLSMGGGAPTTNTLTVFDGTDTKRTVPYNSYAATEMVKSQVIYPASALTPMAGKNITSMKFYVSSHEDWEYDFAWNCYVMETEATVFDDAFLDETAGTLVYTGVIDVTAEEPEFVFNQPFAYNGGNLFVCFKNLNIAEEYNEVKFYGVNQETSTGAWGQWDYFDEDYAFNNVSFLPKATFAYQGGAPTPPVPPAPEEWNPDPEATLTTLTLLSPEHMAQNVANPVVLTWNTDLNAVEYKVEFGTTYPPATVVNWDTITVNNVNYYIAGDLDVNTRYFWRVSIRNSNNTIVSPLYNFVTTMNVPTNVELTETEIFEGETTTVKWKGNAGGGGGGGGFTGELTVADGTATSSGVPVYGLWMDDYTRSETIYPAEMLADMNGGAINQLKYYISSAASGPWTGDVFNVYMMEVDATTLSSYYTSANAEIVYTGGLDGQGANMIIDLTTPYIYNGGNLLIGIEEITCSTWKSCSFYGVEATAASAHGYSGSSLAAVSFNSDNFIPKTTFTCGSKGGDRSLVGYNVYVNDEKVNEEVLTGNNFVLEGLEYNMEGYNVNVTAVYNEGESNYNVGENVVYVSGTGTIGGVVTELMTGEPMAGVAIAFQGSDEFGNSVSYSAVTDDNGEYEIEDVKVGTYPMGRASLETFEPNIIAEPAVVVYDEMTEVNFTLHEVYYPVYGVVAEDLEALAMVKWSMGEIALPNPGPNPGGGGGGSSLTEGFEGGMPSGWNVIDGNSDGYTWCLTSAIPSTWTYYASMTLDWYRTGTNAICSGSYINGVGALTPDEYLVTPQMTIGNGSTFSFWAAATDASYPADHFGVFVSDNGTSNWTSVQEWTLTAKEGANGGRASREGNGAKLGTWYNYSVDLSAYAGSKYIAIRHFNCNDQYIMCVDDISLTGTKGTRDVNYFTLYKKTLLKENMTAQDSTVIADNLTDTLYADVAWAGTEPGLYQYGVSAVYPMPAGDKSEMTTTIDFETGDFSQYDFNNTSAHPWTVVSGDAYAGTYCMKSGNAGIASSISEISAVVTYPSDGTLSFAAKCQGEGTSTIWDKCIFSLDGVEQFCYGANMPGWNVYEYEIPEGEHTLLWKYSKDGSVNPTGDCMLVDDIKFTYDAGGNDNPITPVVWSNVLPKNMETAVTVNAIVNTGSIEGATLTMTNTYSNSIAYTATFDETGTVSFEEFYKGNYVVTVALDGYTSNYNATEVSIWDATTLNAVLNETLVPVETLLVSNTGFARWNQLIPEDKVALSYMIKLNNVYVDQTTDNYYQFDQDDLTVGTTYTAAVAVNYTTGMSAYTETTFTYQGCESVETQVEEFAGEAQGMDIVLTWNGGTPTPPTPPTPPTGNVYSFEGSMEGWTTIDADGDGYDWELGSIMMAGYLIPSHDGEDCVSSQSYDSSAGALTPDNYLVSPSKAEYTAISFWACAQDPSYAAEHFGVAVSTGSNTAAADFTTVQEWTMTAKSAGNAGNYASRSREGREGTWYQYTVDLSAYAGQEIWVAIRHFNCTDMFYIDVDEVTLGTPEDKLANAGYGYGAAANNMTRDWYFYDNGSNDDAIGLTSGGGFYWGIMFPAGSYEGNKVTKVAYFDYAAHTGTVSIYQGGSSAPQTLLHSQNYSVSGTSQYVEFDMDEPVEIDNTQNIWVVMHNNNGQYVAAIDAGPGVNYGSCISTDGSTWYTTVSAASGGSLDGNWNLRFFTESGGSTTTALQPNKYNIFIDGELYGATASTSFTLTATDTEEHTYTVVYIDANFNISCPAEVTLAAGQTCDPVTNLTGEQVEYQGAAAISAQWDAMEGAVGYKVALDGEILGQISGNGVTIHNNGTDLPEGDYTVGVIAVYANCESEMVEVTVTIVLSVDENEIVSAIYPNPTSDDLHINATAMTQISVYNAMGQMVYNQAVNADEMVINMGQFEAGVYMVRIDTENGSSVKRITVVK